MSDGDGSCVEWTIDGRLDMFCTERWDGMGSGEGVPWFTLVRYKPSPPPEDPEPPRGPPFPPTPPKPWNPDDPWASPWFRNLAGCVGERDDWLSDRKEYGAVVARNEGGGAYRIFFGAGNEQITRIDTKGLKPVLGIHTHPDPNKPNVSPGDRETASEFTMPIFVLTPREVRRYQTGDDDYGMLVRGSKWQREAGRWGGDPCSNIGITIN
jgi:hypothetical protein